MSPYNRSTILYFLLCHQSSTCTKRDHSATSYEYQDPETGNALGLPTSHFLCQNVGGGLHVILEILQRFFFWFYFGKIDILCR